MTKATLPTGLHFKKDKAGRPMYFFDRKRIKKDQFMAMQEQNAVIAKQQYKAAVALDNLITEVRALLQPKVTPLEGRLLATSFLINSCDQSTGYSDALDLCKGNPMSANALIGSVIRKGLMIYESKQSAHNRVGGLLTSPSVQNARELHCTNEGLAIAKQVLADDLAC